MWTISSCDTGDQIGRKPIFHTECRPAQEEMSAKVQMLPGSEAFDRMSLSEVIWGGEYEARSWHHWWPVPLFALLGCLTPGNHPVRMLYAPITAEKQNPGQDQQRAKLVI